MTAVLVLIAAYLIGSIDFAVIVARLRGVDIYSVGSGNPGASNVMRTLGRGPAALALLGDMLKGVVATLLGAWIGSEALAFAAGFGAVVGHCYPLYHSFKGGKGMATLVGVMIAGVPAAGVPLAVLWAVIVGASKVASVGSLVLAALAIPAAALAGIRGWALVWLASTTLLVIYRHRGNIARILRREEESL